MAQIPFLFGKDGRPVAPTPSGPGTSGPGTSGPGSAEPSHPGTRVDRVPAAEPSDPQDGENAARGQDVRSCHPGTRVDRVPAGPEAPRAPAAAPVVLSVSDLQRRLRGEIEGTC